MTTENKTIVCFHVGRGGRFNNQGFVSFLGEKNIDDMLEFIRGGYFTRFENQDEICRKINGRENLLNLLELATDGGLGSAAAENKLSKIGLELGEEYYSDCNGNLLYPVSNDGTGTIDIGGEYDTAYCQSIEDCNQHELELIIAYNWDFQDSYLEAKQRLIEEFEVDFDQDNEDENESA